MKVGSPGADGVKYRIYIDEVGNPDLESSDNPNHRYLSLTGVILELDYVQTTLHPQLEALKLKHFRPHPDEPIILHRKEMIHAVEPFAALADDVLRTSFDVELLGLLQDWRYSVVTVCLDKKRHKATYSTWRYDHITTVSQSCSNDTCSSWMTPGRMATSWRKHVAARPICG